VGVVFGLVALAILQLHLDTAIVKEILRVASVGLKKKKKTNKKNKEE